MNVYTGNKQTKSPKQSKINYKKNELLYDELFISIYNDIYNQSIILRQNNAAIFFFEGAPTPR